jgi:UDP-glucose 4-epimerase
LFQSALLKHSKRRSMDIRGKRFLVIGGAGFIGSHTVDALLQEDVEEVCIYDNFSRGSPENLAQALQDSRVKIFPQGGEILHPDVLNAAMQGMDGVFHFAALWLLHCWDFPRSAFEVNIAGTFNILEACIRNNVKRLVFSSSASVYGDAMTEPMQEDHPYNNQNFYGATKVAGEQMCRALYHRYKDTQHKFDYVGLRYMNVYGARQDYRGAYVSVIMKILDRIDSGLAPVVFGDGSQAYDFIYVTDCAKANVCAMKSSATDSFYNVGTGQKTTIQELTNKILEVTRSNLPIQFEPAGQTFVKNRVGCPLRAKQELGFSAKVNLAQGLQDLIAWREAHQAEVARHRHEQSLAIA